MNDFNYTIDCQGLSQALRDLKNALDADTARLLMLWIVEHFAGWVAPWIFPNQPAESSNVQVYRDWAKEAEESEGYPCGEDE